MLKILNLLRITVGVIGRGVDRNELKICSSDLHWLGLQVSFGNLKNLYPFIHSKIFS